MNHNSINGPQSTGRKRIFAVIIMAETISLFVGVGCKKTDLQLNEKTTKAKGSDTVHLYSVANEQLQLQRSDADGNFLPPTTGRGPISTQALCTSAVSAGDFIVSYTGNQRDIFGSTVAMAFTYDVWVPANYITSSSNKGTLKIPAGFLPATTLTGPLSFTLLASDVYNATLGQNANHYTVSFAVTMTKSDYCNYEKFSTKIIFYTDCPDDPFVSTGYTAETSFTPNTYMAVYAWVTPSTGQVSFSPNMLVSPSCHAPSLGYSPTVYTFYRLSGASNWILVLVAVYSGTPAGTMSLPSGDYEFASQYQLDTNPANLSPLGTIQYVTVP